jgi:hypothetical protein
MRVSLVRPTVWGLAIGAAAGAATLISTAANPLQEDSPGAMALWFGSLLLVWIAIGFGAARRSRTFRDAVLAGVLAGLATMAVLDVAAIVRANVFLDEIRHRSDWQNLLARYYASGFRNLRLYATYEYLTISPLLLALGVCAGALSGAVGGAVSGMIHGPRTASR